MPKFHLHDMYGCRGEYPRDDSEGSIQDIFNFPYLSFTVGPPQMR